MQEKISFKNDYSEGAHPNVLELLSQSNLNQEDGYGLDSLSQQAIGLIQQACGKNDAPVYLVSGGTQANLLVISHLLRPYQSVICAQSGHIHVHETGAIESSGHKINLIPEKEGKIQVSDLEKTLLEHTDNHMVMPKMVYISQCTELGTLYSKQELTQIANFCREHELYLFVDGARLAVSLTAPENDLSLKDYAELCDVFYLGATKNGGLLGEAIVFTRPALAQGFDYHLKLKGALMAKGRILGAQFKALLENDLFLSLAEKANQSALGLASVIQELGYPFAYKVQSNQIFPILPNAMIEKLEEKFAFYRWEARGESESVCRFVCSWATRDEAIEQLSEEIKKQHQIRTKN